MPEKKSKSVVSYVDGYVLSVPKKNLAKYRKMAKEACLMWIKEGALSYKECMLDDVNPGGFVTFQFPKMAKTKPDEVTFFSFVEYKSKSHRDSVNKKVMKLCEEQGIGKDIAMPFDMKRFAYGGFKVVVSE